MACKQLVLGVVQNTVVSSAFTNIYHSISIEGHSTFEPSVRLVIVKDAGRIEISQLLKFDSILRPHMFRDRPQHVRNVLQLALCNTGARL